MVQLLNLCSETITLSCLDSSHCFHTSRLPVRDGLELHGRVLDHRIGAADVDQPLVVGADPGMGPPVLDVAGQ